MPSIKGIAPAWRPGLRALVLGVSGVLVIGMPVVVSGTVADHLRAVAVDEAARSAQTVIQGYIDPTAVDGALADPAGPAGIAIDQQLERFVDAGELLRIKIWTLDGTVAFSDLPALRGRNFGVADDLEEVFDGEQATEFSDADEPENVFEHGLADRLLSIYLPI